MDTKTEHIHFDKKFGLITSNQLVLKAKTSKGKIPMESIEGVKLVKYRVLYTNIFLFVFSCVLLIFPAFVIEVDYQNFIPFTILGLFLLIASFIHKFHFYRLEIEEGNQTKHFINTSQIHRKSIKHFHYLLIRKLSKRV